MPNDNVQLLRDIDDAQTRGDLDALFGYMTDDVKVHISGNNRLAGHYEGKASLMEMYGRFIEAAGDYSFENHAYLADDEHGLTLQTGHFKRDGRSLALQEAFICHFRDGKVSEMWYLPVDSVALDEWVGR